MARMITVILFTGILIGCGSSRPEPQQVQTARHTSFESKEGPRRVQPARISITPPRGLIAFTSYRRGAAMIHVLKADGSRMKSLKLGNGATWSPDAKRIAFVQFYNDTNRFEIVVMNADGANLKRLTKSAAEDSTHPQWSRDGGRLVLQSGEFNKPRIYVMTPDGSARKPLTGPGGNDRHPCWSPDGSRIAFTSFRDGPQGIYVMDDWGSQVKRLTAARTQCSEPAWSPNGKQIAFTAYEKRTWSLRIMEADTGNWWSLVESDAQIGSPSWSPGSDWIPFSMKWNNQRDVYIIDANGDGLKNLTNHSKSDSSPAWSPVGIDQCIVTPK